ncbi:hypothetical protein ACFQZO_10855 [Bradyrhizobium sp. GCM10027634]|uniref:hypothetical protein n=1 Tax=unclassified Bradyrhizobium TaxID=2631580 RepID=UPI00263ADF10|nr:hypothetical protein [Bradyrhizobium sp. WYCCWR 12677]MDN5001382.1 hypothetical protein [Bradyrhizobium sp. WYCCWR 12677]
MVQQLAAALLVITSVPGAVFANPVRCRMEAQQPNVSCCAASYSVERCTTFSVLPPPAHRNNGDSMQLAQVAGADSREPQQSLHPEPRTPEALSCELGNAKHDIELLQRLAQEHDRADQLEQALAAMRHEVDAKTALADQAREEAAQLKQAAEGDSADLRKSLEEERTRTRQLERALAAAQRDLDAQTARAAKATDEAATLRQSVKAAAAEQSRSIQKEHDRAEALAQDLSSARTKIYAYEAQAKASDEAAQLKQEQESHMASACQSQQQERDRAEQLARDLAKANSDLQAQTERASKASEGVLAIKQAKERDSAELRSMLQRERERVQKLETEIASAHPDNGAFVARFPSIAPQFAAAGTTLREQPIGALTQQLKSAPVLESRVPDEQVRDQTIGLPDAKEVRVNSDEAAQVARLIARSSLLLEQGDIGSARTVLEHIVRMGSAQAIFVLAETYDPLTLPSFGTFGTHGDASRARDLYAQAEVRGIKEAKPRLDALGR